MSSFDDSNTALTTLPAGHDDWLDEIHISDVERAVQPLIESDGTGELDTAVLLQHARTHVATQQLLLNKVTAKLADKQREIDQHCQQVVELEREIEQKQMRLQLLQLQSSTERKEDINKLKEQLKIEKRKNADYQAETERIEAECRELELKRGQDKITTQSINDEANQLAAQPQLTNSGRQLVNESKKAALSNLDINAVDAKLAELQTYNVDVSENARLKQLRAATSNVKEVVQWCENRLRLSHNKQIILKTLRGECCQQCATEDEKYQEFDSTLDYTIHPTFKPLPTDKTLPPLVNPVSTPKQLLQYLTNQRTAAQHSNNATSGNAAPQPLMFAAGSDTDTAQMPQLRFLSAESQTSTDEEVAGINQPRAAGRLGINVFVENEMTEQDSSD